VRFGEEVFLALRGGALVKRLRIPKRRLMVEGYEEKY
jgi:hypothetical protein